MIVLPTCCRFAAALQSRGFVRARSSGDLEAYTFAVSRAIVDENDDDVVQVRYDSLTQSLTHLLTPEAPAGSHRHHSVRVTLTA